MGAVHIGIVQEANLMRAELFQREIRLTDLCAGCRNADLDLYYLDVSDQSIFDNVGDPADMAASEATAVRSEGWSLQTTKGVLSSATNEQPHMRLPDRVNHPPDLPDTTTAPWGQTP